MKAVIDTNVLLVANRQHDDVSPECVQECVKRLLSMQKGGITVVDDGFRILREYQNKTHPNQPKGVGDAYLKWLLQNKSNPRHVEQVAVTVTGIDTFEEFPCPELQPEFDAPDRKFVAVANAHPDKPPILQAADCKWLDWWPELAKQGARADFLCPEDACRFYRGKFPNKPEPELPAK